MNLGKGSKGNLHRRARSSVGTTRKASAKREGKFSFKFISEGTNSQPRGALIGNIPD